MNGATVTHGFFINQDTCLPDKGPVGSFFWSTIYETISLGLNLITGPSCNFTMNNAGEIISRKIETGGVSQTGHREVVYELGDQNQLLFDCSLETFGASRLQNESLAEFMRRVRDQAYTRNSQDHATAEFSPKLYQHLNAKIKTCPQTYYFAITSSERQRVQRPRFEIIEEPEISSYKAQGFDTDIADNLHINGKAHKGPQRFKGTLKQYLWTIYTQLKNPAGIYAKLFLNSFTDYRPPAHLNNLFNSNMNDLMAIDYANREVTDCDGILPRWSQEYPRLSAEFKTKT